MTIEKTSGKKSAAAKSNGGITFEQINRELSSSLDISVVLSSVLFQSIKLVGAERGTLIIMDEEGSPIDAAIVYFRQLIPHTVEQLRETLRQGLAGWVYKHQEPVLIEDTSQDNRWLQRPDDSADQTGPKSAICVPILAPRGELVGILTIVHSTPGYLSNEHLTSLNTMANYAGNAIFNARLYNSLSHAQVRLQGLFESSIDPIVISDLQGRFMQANNRFHIMTSLSPDALAGRSIETFYPEFDEDYLRRAEILTSGQVNTGEANLVFADGRSMPAEVYIEKILLGGKAALQWIFRDISERKALTMLQEEMVAMVYHDLKSPLSNVVSALDMIESSLPEECNETIRSMLEIADRSTSRIQRLVNSLLDIYELEAGQEITSQVKAGIENILRDAVNAVLPSANNKEIEIRYALRQGLPKVFVDPDMITRVMINLLENSIRFSHPGGVISIDAERQDAFVRVSVRDDGLGLPKGLEQQIFNKFFKSSQRDKFGNGLGLAFCKLVVEAHGGEISAHNNDESGATVTLTLPVFDNQYNG